MMREVFAAGDKIRLLGMVRQDRRTGDAVKSLALGNEVCDAIEQSLGHLRPTDVEVHPQSAGGTRQSDVPAARGVWLERDTAEL